MQRDVGGSELDNPYRSPPPLVADAAIAVASDSAVPEELKPFRTIWTRPRDTIRWIVATNPELHVVLLICLAGIGKSLDRASMRNAGDHLPMATIIAAACVVGPLGGLLSLWVSSHLIRITGAWLGGVGNREHIKAALAWASVPAVFSILLWLPQLLLAGPDMFTSETPRLDAQPMLLIPLLVTSTAEAVLSVWSFVLLCNTIAEVQGFRSAWRGLGNLFLAGLLIALPIFAIVFSAILLTRM